MVRINGRKTMSKTKGNILQTIYSPEDLKKVNIDDLPQLCKEIREYMLNILSEHPGHLASSLGAVELTVAIHYIFNTPYDRVVWDVGHQAYVHKILTERKDKFNTIRQLNGLSGFPSPSESKYDTFTAGHASNSISAALGMSVAANLNNEDRKVIAVIGDAAISGGLAFEGLNNASSSPNDLLIILNDNDMAIDHNVGALNKYLVKITTSPRYNRFRYNAYSFLRRHKIIRDNHKGVFTRFTNSLKSLISHQQNIFEGLNIRYFGPIDGHDTKSIIKILSDIKEIKGPKLLHLKTIKGKGYLPAEKDVTVWHAPGKFNVDTGERVKSNNTTTRYQDVFGETLVELAEKNNKIVGITPAMPSGCSMNFMRDKFPNRFFDVGIAEEHAVTFSGGLAKEGLKPFCNIYSSFLQRAYDEIIHDVAIQNLPVVFCIDRAGIVGEDGVTHHGSLDIAYLRCIPNMIISAPMDEHYLRHLMYTAANTQNAPFSIRYPRGCGKLLDWRCEPQILEIGKGRQICDGKDIAILSIGSIGNTAIEAINKAKENGIEVALYDMIFAKPIDTDILTFVAEKYDKIITIEDGTINGGFGSAVSEIFSQNGYNCKIKMIGIHDKFITHGKPSELYKICKMDSNGIYEAIVGEW